MYSYVGKKVVIRIMNNNFNDKKDSKFISSLGI